MSVSVPEPVRKYVYSILLPLAAVLVYYGVASSEEVTLWLGVAAVVLGVPATELARARVAPLARRGDSPVERA
jgi:hypothetical protein